MGTYYKCDLSHIFSIIYHKHALTPSHGKAKLLIEKGDFL